LCIWLCLPLLSSMMTTTNQCMWAMWSLQFFSRWQSCSTGASWVIECLISYIEDHRSSQFTDWEHQSDLLQVLSLLRSRLLTGEICRLANSGDTRGGLTITKIYLPWELWCVFLCYCENHEVMGSHLDWHESADLTTSELQVCICMALFRWIWNNHVQIKSGAE
jgi:hypothetical protein